MLNQALNINKPQNIKKADEITEEEFEQINKDISKVLDDMKKQKQDENNESNSDEEKEDEQFDFFDKDFFTDSSNSISFDNFSDISEKSFKSTNPETTNNTLKKNIMKNNSNNNVFYNNEIIPDTNNKFKKDNLKEKKSSDKIIDIHLQKKFNDIHLSDKENNINNNMKNNIIPENNKNFNNIKINLLNNNNILPINPGNNQFNGYNNINNMIMNSYNNNNNNLFQINNNPNFPNNNIINNQILPINNFPINNFPNPNFQMINNNINNNLNLINQNKNNYINNPLLYNINNNSNNNNIFMNERKNDNNSFSYPIISERGVPGFYNLDSPKNIINIDNILRNRDKRTTLIIRNIPNKYTIALLLKELNKNYENKFDIVYLPQDYINNSNLGFGFINFVNPLHLVLFYEEFMNKKWNYFNSKKRCSLAYSKYQGKNELIKYILTKLGISSLDNNSESIRKSFHINNNKNIRSPIEIPLKYYTYFVSYHPFSLCHNKDDKVFIVDKYYNV